MRLSFLNLGLAQRASEHRRTHELLFSGSSGSHVFRSGSLAKCWLLDRGLCLVNFYTGPVKQVDANRRLKINRINFSGIQMCFTALVYFAISFPGLFP